MGFRQDKKEAGKKGNPNKKQAGRPPKVRSYF